MAMALVLFSRGQRRQRGVIALVHNIYGWEIGFWVGGLLGFLRTAAADADPGIARLPRPP